MASKRAIDWRSGSNRRAIAECAESGMTQMQTYSELKPRVTAQTLVFTRNPDRSMGESRRIPKPISEQYIELQNEIGRVWKLMGLSKTDRFQTHESDEDEIPNETQEDDAKQDDSEDEIPSDESDNGDDAPRAKGKAKLQTELAYFLRRVREIRRFCWERARQSAPVDNISMRPAQAGAKLIPAGVPADVLLLTMTMHWSPETRSDAGIDSWDFNGEGLTNPHPGMLAVSHSEMRSRGIDPHSTDNPKIGKPHPLFGYALLIAESRIPMMLIGPAGTGKSHLTEQLANYMTTDAHPERLPYGESPMSAGASRSDLLGRHTINAEKPFITAEAIERFSKGGVFSFEEIDRGDPSVLIVLNNALARGILFNPVNGENYVRHADFVPVATANTMGLGANREYGTAERLDGATLDRFRMGRIFLPLDEDLEADILYGRI
jgi:hypothetical protein